MEIYIELTYIINAFVYIIVFEILSILLNVNWSLYKIILYSFLCNISLILIYIDYLPYISLLYWGLIFLGLFRKQFFLYFPAFIIVYFSVLLFIHSLIESSFIYNGILITPTSYTDIIVICIAIVFVIVEYLYIAYTRKKITHDSYLYDVRIIYLGKSYVCRGFLDSGNEAYYHGFPLIFIKKDIIASYQKIDTYTVMSLTKQQIDIICAEKVYLNEQILSDVYIGIMDHLQYDCLLNKELMGGII